MVPSKHKNEIKRRIEKMFKKNNNKPVPFIVIRAPEDVSYYHRNKQWPTSFKKTFDILPHRFEFSVNNTDRSPKQRASKSRPFFYAGAEIRDAWIQTRKTTSGRIIVGEDNIFKLNDILYSFCGVHEVDKLKLESFMFYSCDSVVEYRNYSPDGLEDQLYFFREIRDGKSFYFVEVLDSRQRELAKGYCDRISYYAKCAAHVKNIKQKIEKKAATECELKVFDGELAA